MQISITTTNKFSWQREGAGRSHGHATTSRTATKLSLIADGAGATAPTTPRLHHARPRSISIHPIALLHSYAAPPLHLIYEHIHESLTTLLMYHAIMHDTVTAIHTGSKF